MFEKVDAGKIDQVIDMAFRIGKSYLDKQKTKNNANENSLGLAIKVHVDLSKNKHMVLSKNYGSKFWCSSILLRRHQLSIKNKLERWWLQWNYENFNSFFYLFFDLSIHFFNLFFNIFQSYFTVRFHKTSHINTPMAGRYLLAQR